MSAFRIAAAAILFISAAAALGQNAPAPAPDPAPRPTMPADFTVTPMDARQTATDLARKLEDNYVFPDIGRRYAEMLRANAASGAYDGLTSGRALAERLTADLRAISPDAHLRVRPGPPMAPPPPSGTSGAAHSAQMHPVFPWKPIEEARWLAPGIAYIRFNVFPGDPETVAAARRFMIDHASAKVIIFDNRTHHGGGIAEMNAMFPYLFAKPTTLVTMDTRASVDHADHDPHPMERLVPGPAGVVRREHYVLPSKTEKRLFKARVFVLTSGRTGSAAEHMTLALKHTHRATIVGEPTVGADHYGDEEKIGERFSAFIPVGRSSDPDTGRDWEGVGIEPDVAVPAEQALIEALVLSGLSQPEAERISATVKPSQAMNRRIPRVLPPGGHGI